MGDAVHTRDVVCDADAARERAAGSASEESGGRRRGESEWAWVRERADCGRDLRIYREDVGRMSEKSDQLLIQALEAATGQDALSSKRGAMSNTTRGSSRPFMSTIIGGSACTN